MRNLKFGLIGILLFSGSALAELSCSVTSYHGGAANKGASGSGKYIELSDSGFDFVAQDPGNGRLSMSAYDSGKPIASYDGYAEKNKVQALTIITDQKSGMIRMHCLQK